MKKIILMVVVSVLAAHVSFGGLKWGNAPNVIDDFDGNPVATSDSLDPLEGVFAQLIRILIGTTPSAFVSSGSGVSGNDVVVDTMYAGQYDDLSDPGTLAFNPNTILNSGTFNGTYYVRVFDAPQLTLDNWNLGTGAPIPTGAQYYFQSTTYSYTHNETEPSVFDIGSGQTTLAIPEPSSVILMASGLVGLLALRRRKI